MNINRYPMNAKRKRSKATVVWGSCFDGEIVISANCPSGTALRSRKKDICEETIHANIASNIND